VTAAAVITFIGAGFAVLAGLVILAFAAGSSNSHEVFGETAGGFFAVFAVIILGFAALGIIAGVYLLRGSKAWAIVLTVFHGLGVLSGLGNLGSRSPGTGVFSLMVSIAVLICLWVPASRRYYDSRR